MPKPMIDGVGLMQLGDVLKRCYEPILAEPVPADLLMLAAKVERALAHQPLRSEADGIGGSSGSDVAPSNHSGRRLR
jgi:hypothetical protein